MPQIVYTFVDALVVLELASVFNAFYRIINEDFLAVIGLYQCEIHIAYYFRYPFGVRCEQKPCAIWKVHNIGRVRYIMDKVEVLHLVAAYIVGGFQRLYSIVQLPYILVCKDWYVVLQKVTERILAYVVAVSMAHETSNDFVRLVVQRFDIIIELAAKFKYENLANAVFENISVARTSRGYYDKFVHCVLV